MPLSLCHPIGDTPIPTTPTKTPSKYAKGNGKSPIKSKANPNVLSIAGRLYTYQKGELAGQETGNGGIIWTPPRGTNKAYLAAIGEYDLEHNNKWVPELTVYNCKTPMAASAQKVYDALVAVPRAPGIQVEIDTASLTALDTMLKNKEVTLNLTQSGPEAILQGTAT